MLATADAIGWEFCKLALALLMGVILVISTVGTFVKFAAIELVKH